MEVTYWPSRNLVMTLKVSTSLRTVSSKPGVSMRHTGRPSKSNLGAASTSRVQGSNDAEVGRSEPPARFMNYSGTGSIRIALLNL